MTLRGKILYINEIEGGQTVDVLFYLALTKKNFIGLLFRSMELINGEFWIHGWEVGVVGILNCSAAR